MRLEPIERPRGLVARLAYWRSRRQFGKVPSVLKVAYARSPQLAMLGYRITRFCDRGLTIEPSLRLLVQLVVAEQAGCGFCVDIGRAIAVDSHLGLEKFDALGAWETSPLFSERERAALAYATEAGHDGRVRADTFERLRASFREREIIDITAMVAIERFYNAIALPLGLGPDGLCSLAQSRRPRLAAAS